MVGLQINNSIQRNYQLKHKHFESIILNGQSFYFNLNFAYLGARCTSNNVGIVNITCLSTESESRYRNRAKRQSTSKIL